MKAIINYLLFLSISAFSAFEAVQCSSVGISPIHRQLNETEDCFSVTKTFKYGEGRISCNDVVANTTLCTTSWKAGKKCQVCGNCQPEVTEPEECFLNTKKFKFGDGKISCNDVILDTTLCTTSWKASEKCEICGECTPPEVTEPEECFLNTKKFKYGDGKISCNDVILDTTLCTTSWKASKKCEICGACTPPGVEETEDCFPGTKTFKYEDGKISCNDVTSDTTLCTTSWKAGKKCEVCGNCEPDDEEPEEEDCFAEAQKFKHEDGRITCSSVTADPTLCESSWRAAKKCEVCGNCKPKVVEAEDCFSESHRFKHGDGKITCSAVTADPTLCDNSWKASKKCEVCGTCTPETS